MTPNKVEYSRLVKSLYEEEREDHKISAEEETEFMDKHKNTYGKLDTTSILARGVASLASELNNVVILRKGIVDIVSNGFQTYYVAVEGGLKRSGGQGDVLAGVLGTFAYFEQNLE